MDRGEPTFVPQWYKSSGTGGVTSNQHCRTSSNSDDHGSWLPSRNRPSTSGSNHDRYRTTSFDSLRRSASSNGSMSHGKDGAVQLRASSSFGKSRRDGDRGKDDEHEERSRPRILQNGTSDSYKSSRTDIDTPRRSLDTVTRQRAESRSTKPVKDVNGVHLVGSISTSIGKASFERDFPSLGAEHKGHDLSRISSTGPKTAIQSLPVGPSAIVGGNGWTSPLAELPASVGSNGPAPCSSVQTATKSLPSTGLSTPTGLNMAETLAQPPPQIRNAPQLSVDTQRMEELARIQSSKLIPVMPSTSKNSILNSSDKSKSKATKGVDPKQLSSQLASHASHTLPTPARSPALKTPQTGNLQVLNKERNDILLVAKECPNLMNTSRIVTPSSHVTSAAPLKIPINPKTKVDSKRVAILSQGPSGEKRPSQAQKRHDFFNSLRKKSSANLPSVTESICNTPANSLEGTQQSDGTSSSINQDDSFATIPGSDFSIPKDSDVSRVCDASEEPLELDDDLNDDEKAFLESLGWDKDAQVEVLTAEEIDAFVKEHGQVRQSLKLSHHDVGSCNTQAASSTNSP